MLKIGDVKKFCQDIEDDPIIKEQMAGLGCLFVCTFGNFLAFVLIAARTVNNLNFGDEPEGEGYESEPSNLALSPLTNPGRLNKMINLFKNVSLYIIQKTCEKVVHIEPRSLVFVSDRFKTQEMCNEAIEKVPWLLYDVHRRTPGMCIRAVEKCLHPLRFIPDHLKTQGICEKAIEKNPWQLGDFPDHFKTREMCERAVKDEPETLQCVPDHLKTQEMCTEAARIEPFLLAYVPDRFQTQKICNEVVRRELCTLDYVPNPFKTQEISNEIMRKNPATF